MGGTGGGSGLKRYQRVYQAWDGPQVDPGQNDSRGIQGGRDQGVGPELGITEKDPGSHEANHVGIRLRPLKRRWITNEKLGRHTMPKFSRCFSSLLSLRELSGADHGVWVDAT